MGHIAFAVVGENAMRQYIILYKRGQAKEFGRLKPIEHKGLYDRFEVNVAIAAMRNWKFMEGACVRIDDELFNIVSFDQEAKAPDAFELDFPKEDLAEEGA